MTPRHIFIIDENGIEIPVDGISKLNKGDIFRMEPTDEHDPVDPRQQWKATSDPLIELDGEPSISCIEYPRD